VASVSQRSRAQRNRAACLTLSRAGLALSRMGCYLRPPQLLVLVSCAICTDGASLRHRAANSTATASINSALEATLAAEHSNISRAAVATNTNTSGVTRAPRVFFLFLAVDKVSNLGVWWSFFRNAPTDQYRAYVHCKLDSCKQMVAGSPLQVVPTVPSYYCTDLVSPMNQLLMVALRDEIGQANPNDKFAFISDSSLPAKPFSSIYQTLSARDGSDFCVFPSNEWADIPSAGGLEMAAKFHQWITLSRPHAEKALQLWWDKTLHEFMWKFQMNSQSWQYNDNSYGDSRNFGCLDEFWHMAALYGTMGQVDTNQDRRVDMASFVGGPIWISRSAGWQGQCDTFVIWSKYLHTAGKNPFERLHASLDFVSIPHGGNDARPGWWDTISTTGISVIRNSDFLFVRKFIDAPRLADGPDFAEAYSRIVFAA